MKRFTTYFLLLLTFILCSTGQLLAGAAYPVQLNAQIMPPYTNCLGDLVADNVSRIRVTALLRDMNMKSYNVGIGMKVYQGSQLKFSTMNNHTELVTPNTLHTFNVKDLFTPANVVGRYDGDGYCLKEGGYEFVFQAYDGGNAQLPLSEPVHFFAYLSQAEPPRPIAPANGECVSYNAPVNFVWMEGAVTSFNPNRSYRIEIFELPENMEKTDAKSFISTSSTKFTIDNIPGNLNFYTFQNTAGKLVKGRKYLWRVQLYDKTQQVSDGREVYSSSSMVANGGYSEVYSFSFNNCDPFGKQEENLVDDSKKPILIRVDSSEAQSTVVWKKEPDKYPYGYVVCFNTADDTLSNWAKVEVGPEDSSYTFKNVSTGVRYLTHIIGIVDQKEDGTKTMSANSDRGSFTMPVPVEQECSKTIDAVTSKWSIASLNPGNYITANDRNIKITEVTQTISGNDTLYSGKGVVLCPWMPTVSLITKFENVKINRNFELIKGMVYVPTDKSNCLFVDLDEWTNDQYKGTGPAETQKTSIPEYQSVDQIPEGELGVVDGKLFANEDGKATYIGKVESADKYNKNVIQSNGLDADHGLVRFEHISNWNPPMDGERGEGYYGDVSDYYTTLNSNYSVPWFAMVEGKTKSIKGEISLGRESANDVKFVCLVGDQAIILDAKFDGNYTYTIPIFGGTGETSLDVYALATGANGDNLTLGHARIQNMPKMDQKVILIPVKREPGSIAKDDIEKQLNAIYGPLGITYKVEVADKFDGEDLSFLDDGLDVVSISSLTTSSEEMKRLKNMYAQNHTIDEQAAYIFVCPKATYNGAEVKGDMPRCSQVGYVFSEAATYNDGWTIAHELGHGLYSFEHVFTKEKNKGNTNNLMDYNNGTILKVWQWNLLYSHKNYTMPFLEKDEDGMYNTWDYVEYDIISNFKSINEIKELAFIVPDGDGLKRVVLPESAVDFGFTCIDPNQSNGDLCLPYLTSFTIEGERWLAFLSYKDGKAYFIGFYKDAVKKSSAYDPNSYFYDLSKSDPFNLEVSINKGNIIVPVRRSGGCGKYDIYTFNSEKVVSVEDLKVIEDNLTNVDLMSIYDCKNVGSISEGFNCLKGGLKSFYKFIVDHYNSYKHPVSDEQKQKLIKELMKYNDLHVLTSREIGNINADIELDVMLTYGVDKLITSLEEIDKNDILNIQLTNPDLYYKLQELPEEKIAILSAILDCILAKSNLKKQFEKDISLDIWFLWDILVRTALNVTHDVLLIPYCVLNGLYVPDTYWNADRVDYDSNELIDAMLGLGVTAINPIVSLAITDPKLKVACGAGMWNCFVEQLQGIHDIPLLATDAELAVQIGKKLKETASNISSEYLSEKWDAFKNMFTLENVKDICSSVAEFAEEEFDKLKQFHGYDGRYNNSYQTSYAVCYDATFVATVFVAPEKVVTSAAKKMGVLIASNGYKKIGGHIVNKILTAKGNKIYSKTAEAFTLEYIDDGVRILKKSEKFEDFKLCEKKIVNKETGKSGYVFTTNDGAGFINESDYQLYNELAEKISTPTQKNGLLEKFYNSVEIAEDGAIKIKNTPKNFEDLEFLSAKQYKDVSGKSGYLYSTKDGIGFIDVDSYKLYDKLSEKMTDPTEKHDFLRKFLNCVELTEEGAIKIKKSPEIFENVNILGSRQELSGRSVYLYTTKDGIGLIDASDYNIFSNIIGNIAKEDVDLYTSKFFKVIEESKVFMMKFRKMSPEQREYIGLDIDKIADLYKKYGSDITQFQKKKLSVYDIIYIMSMFEKEAREKIYKSWRHPSKMDIAGRLFPKGTTKSSRAIDRYLTNFANNAKFIYTVQLDKIIIEDLIKNKSYTEIIMEAFLSCADLYLDLITPKSREFFENKLGNLFFSGVYDKEAKPFVLGLCENLKDQNTIPANTRIDVAVVDNKQLEENVEETASKPLTENVRMVALLDLDNHVGEFGLNPNSIGFTSNGWLDVIFTQDINLKEGDFVLVYDASGELIEIEKVNSEGIRETVKQ